jgi:hypothetical protein
MIQQTLAQARPALTQVSGMTGMSLTDARFVARINLAQEEIINEGDWPGVVDRWHMLFDEITGELVLPYYLDRLMQVTVDRCPTQIMSPWAEFVNYGAGPQDDTMFAGSGNQFIPRNWIGDCLDRGEVPSRRPIPPDTDATTYSPWVLRLYTTVSEGTPPPVVNLQGYDDDGLLIRTQSDGEWINGENLTLVDGTGYAQSTSQFSKLTHVVKPQTNGYVRLAAYSASQNLEITLSDYAPVETTPSYRNYFIQQLWRPTQGVCNRVVLARARRRFVPVAQDEDVLIIGNTNALKCMMIAQWKRDAGDYDAYAVQKAQAVDILRKEATAYNGKSRTPAISFTRGFPLGAYPYAH